MTDPDPDASASTAASPTGGSSAGRLPPAALRAAAFLPWVAILAWLIGDTWFFTEDSFIAFRYVRNIVEGNGPVFNVDERVEGCVNGLWLYELAALWAWFGIRPEIGVHVISIGFTAATLALVVVRALGTPFREHRWLVAWMSVGLLSCSVTFAAWSTGGLETRQFTFLVFAGISLMSRFERPCLLAAGSTVLAIAETTRPEALLIWGCCGLGYLAAAPRHDRRAWVTGLLAAGLPFAVLVALHFLVRYGYYGDWLPNPFYAKHVRPWYEAGLRYVAGAMLETGGFVLVGLTMLSAWRLRSSGRGNDHLVALLCVFFHAAYLARIGGDHFEFRPLDLYWPLLALGAADEIAWIGLRLTQAARRGTGRPSAAAPTAALFALVLGYASLVQGLFWFRTRQFSTRAETHRLNVELAPGQLPAILRLPGLGTIMDASNAARTYLIPHLIGIRVKEHAVFAEHRYATWSPYERLPRNLIPSDAVAATGAVGAMPFYLPDLTVIDTLGLTDRVVARHPVDTPNAERKIAHDRRAPPGYLEARGVNIYIHPPASTVEEALARAPFAAQAAEGFWMPFDALDPEWVRRAFAHVPVAARTPLPAPGRP